MQELLDVIRSATAPPLVTVTGPAGVGRTTLLARLQDSLRTTGSRVVPMRFARGGGVVPAQLALQPGRAPSPDGGPDPVLPHPTHHSPPWSPIGPVEGAHDDPGRARWAGAAAAAPLLVTGNAVLLIDDVQWIDRDSMAVLESLVRRIAGTTVACVCAVRSPMPAAVGVPAAAALARLRDDGLVHAVRVRPLDATGIVEEVRAATRATPAPELVDRLRALSRGIHAPLRDAIAAMQASGAIRVVDRHAYLVATTGATDPPHEHRLVESVRGLGPDAWAAAKAAAVLHPFGAQLPGLMAAALGSGVEHVGAQLALLRSEGVLHRGRHGASWRFAVPFVGAALRDCLGPYERRHLAATAVTAVWAGTAHCADADYVTDRVADAGRLVDPVRARAELVARAEVAMSTSPAHAERWWRAATELAEDRPQRAHTLMMHAITCFVSGDYEGSRLGTQTVLRYHTDQITPEAEQQAQVMLVCAMHNVGDIAGLEDVAAGRRIWHGEDAARTISRAIALSLLDRWAEARELLVRTRDVWTDTRVTTALGELFEMLADAWAGRPERFEKRLAGTGHWPVDSVEQHWVNHVNALVTSLLSLGDLRRAEQLLADEGLPVERLNVSDRALLASMQGRFDDAADLARRCVAGGASRGYDAGRSAMHQGTAYLLIARGQLTRAREVLANARAARPALAHLLENPEAEVAKILGDRAGAEKLLSETVLAARERELVVGSELSWAQLAELALVRDDRDGARRCLTEIDGVAEALQTSRSAMYAQLVRAVVERDEAAGAESVQLCRDRGQPFELAITITRLIGHGMGDPALLREAYDVFGELDALLCRAWTRNQMWTHDIAIPGRSVTVAENERLLAQLVAEGLGNKQLAFVLRTSDKSVEGRLSRLFARTGYRSRIELAAALQSSDYEA